MTINENNMAKDYAEKVRESLIEDYNAIKPNAEDYGDSYAEFCDAWVRDAFDIEYTLDRRLEYIGARIAVTVGGPACYINTRRWTIECYWGLDSWETPIPYEICNMLNNELEYCYNCFK